MHFAYAYDYVRGTKCPKVYQSMFAKYVWSVDAGGNTVVHWMYTFSQTSKLAEYMLNREYRVNIVGHVLVQYFLIANHCFSYKFNFLLFFGSIVVMNTSNNENSKWNDTHVSSFTEENYLLQVFPILLSNIHRMNIVEDVNKREISRIKMILAHQRQATNVKSNMRMLNKQLHVKNRVFLQCVSILPRQIKPSNTTDSIESSFRQCVVSITWSQPLKSLSENGNVEKYRQIMVNFERQQPIWKTTHNVGVSKWWNDCLFAYFCSLCSQWFSSYFDFHTSKQCIKYLSIITKRQTQAELRSA